MNAAEPLRAPDGARGWAPHTGWLYSGDELAEHVDGDAYVLTVSGDGLLRGVTDHDPAPLRALLRVEVDVTEIAARIDDLADTVAGQDIDEATDINMMRARMDALVRRVDKLERRAR